MPTVSRARRLAIAAAVLALPLSVLPLASASADPAPPVFSYLDSSTNELASVLFSANADGTSPTALAPAGYQTLSYDVSQDGNTELLGLCRATVADCNGTGSFAGFYYDRVSSLVLVHRDTYGTRARVLATNWDVRPALAANGDAVWMTDDVLYKLHVDYSTADWAAAGAGTLTSSTAWAPASSWLTEALAVSPDGTQVAVIQDDGVTPNPDVKLLAGPFTGITAGVPNLQVLYASSAARFPSSSTFAFLDSTHLAFGAYQPLDSPEYTIGNRDYSPTYTEIGTLDSAGGTHAENTALYDTYALRGFGAGAWYAWKDHAGVSTDMSGYATVTGDLTASGTTTVGTFTDRSNGATTFRYIPTATTPPVLASTDQAVNRSAGHPVLRLRSSLVGSNARDYFVVGNLFYQDPAQGPYDATAASIISRGELEYSVDGRHWFNSTGTSGQNSVKVGTSTYMGSTQKLTRNTWFRWYYPGDIMTAGGRSRAHLVKVAPGITVKVATSGSNRTVYGTVLRSGGKIVLLHKVGSRYRTVATVAISKKGAFSFGKKRLAKGTYEVVSLADVYWAASTKVFKV
jgi:hypothetical protein